MGPTCSGNLTSVSGQEGGGGAGRKLRKICDFIIIVFLIYQTNYVAKFCRVYHDLATI